MIKNKPGLRRLRFRCMEILPTIFDDKKSYYEVVCKLQWYINQMLEDQQSVNEALDQIDSELSKIQGQFVTVSQLIADLKEWQDNFSTTFAESIVREWLEKNLVKMIFVYINNTGNIMYAIPETWDEIKFNTTGWDIQLTQQPEYGHLVLSY